MNRTAIIVTEDFSNIFNEDKSFLMLNNKPLIKYAVDAVSGIVDEVIIAIKSEAQKKRYELLLEPGIKLVVQDRNLEGQLGSILAALELAQGKHTLLLSCDMPLASTEILELFFELCQGKTAVIPRWPSQQIEPLHSVYHTKTAKEAAKIAVEEGLFELENMIENMGGIRYMSTLAFQELDPELRTLFKVGTPLDLKTAEYLIKPKRIVSHRKRKH